MNRLLILVGATMGGAIGWWLGDHVGLMTAFLASVLGTGAGVYFGLRVARRYLP
jgi:hypothetical protein